jgi:hypothetical protein
MPVHLLHRAAGSRKRVGILRNFHGRRKVSKYERFRIDVPEPVVSGGDGMFGCELVVNPGIDPIAVKSVRGRYVVVTYIALTQPRLIGGRGVPQSGCCNRLNELLRDTSAGKRIADVARGSSGTVRIQPSRSRIVNDNGCPLVS